MKKTSSRALQGLFLLLLLLTILGLLLAVQRSSKLQSSLKSGRFEARYSAAIDKLKEQTGTLRDKLNAGMPENLKLLPEELLRQRATDKEEPVEEEPVFGKIRLRGIYWSDTMPLAEINNRLCKPGDEIQGYTLNEIHPYQVILTDFEGSRVTNSLIKGLESHAK